MGKKCCSRVCAPALGLGFGIATGLMMMALAWISWKWGYGTSIVEQHAALYHGYASSLEGGLFGGLWGLIEGFIFGLVAAWVYNICARCCGCFKNCSTCSKE